MTLAVSGQTGERQRQEIARHCGVIAPVRRLNPHSCHHALLRLRLDLRLGERR